MEKVKVNSERWFSLEDLEEEEWKEVPNSYCMISNYGRLKRLAYEKDIFNQSVYRHYHYEERILKATLSPYGYYHTRIIINNKLTDVRINRLVAEAFVPNPKNLPFVNHKNEITTDNHASNLEYCTAAYNANYGTARERMIKTRINNDKEKWHTIKQYDLSGNLINSFNHKKELEQSGYNYYMVAKCCKHMTPSTMGFVWRYDSDPPSYSIKGSHIKDRNSKGQIVAIPISQYTLDGKYVRTFKRISDAASYMKGNTTMICNCCSGKIPTAYGYVWRYKDDPVPEPYVNKKYRIVLQFTKEMKFVTEYPSLKEAAMAFTGDSKKWTSIWECCSGRAKTYKGYIWKYKEE